MKDRTHIGDWEGDTVYGAVGKHLVVTLADRKTGYLLAGKIESRNALFTEKVVVTLLKDNPVKSVSSDNGSAFANFRERKTNFLPKLFCRAAQTLAMRNQ